MVRGCLVYCPCHPGCPTANWHDSLLLTATVRLPRLQRQRYATHYSTQTYYASIYTLDVSLHHLLSPRDSKKSPLDRREQVSPYSPPVMNSGCSDEFEAKDKFTYHSATSRSISTFAANCSDAANGSRLATADLALAGLGASLLSADSTPANRIWC